jgi:hypothetical protein
MEELLVDSVPLPDIAEDVAPNVKRLNLVSKRFSQSSVLNLDVKPASDPFQRMVPPALKKYRAASTDAKV